MLRRTLTVLTPALFALPLLLTPTSQLHADDNRYSGSECEYRETRWNAATAAEEMSYAHPGITATGGDVVYHPALGIGNDAPSDRTPAGNYLMFVRCPLPPLMTGQQVVVAIIDNTPEDDVSCRIQSCAPGIGIGTAGEYTNCNQSPDVGSNSANASDGYTQDKEHITLNVDFLTIEAPAAPMSPLPVSVPAVSRF